MVPVPKHVGISYRAKGKCASSRAAQTGYIVQTGGKTHGGFHKTYAAALETLRLVLGVRSTKQLKLKPQFRKATSSKSRAHRVPYVRQRAKYGQWYCPQVALGKSFASQSEAAQALKKSQLGKVFLATAKKTMTQAGEAPALPPKKLAHRIQCLAKFAFGSRKRKWLPADAHAAAQHRTLSHQMYQCDTVLHILSLVFKYGPWKAALLHEWESTASWPEVGQLPMRPAVQSSESQAIDYKRAVEEAGTRANAVQCLLADVAKLIHQNPVNPEWAANANRFGGRFNGPDF